MYVCHNMDEHWIYYAELMKPAIDKTTSKEKFNLVGLDDSFPNKPHGSWGKSVSVQTVNYYMVYSRSPQPLIYGLLGSRPQSKRWAMGKEEKLDGYLEPLLITHIAIWSPPPVRLAAALDSHRSMNPTVNCSCEGSRLSTPYENLIPYDLRWSWSDDASTGEHLQVPLSLAERLTAESLQ